MRNVAASPSSPAAQSPISVALIEDNRIVREGMVALMSRREELRIVAAGPNLSTVDRLPEPPQVLLLDIGLEHADSLAVAHDARSGIPESRVIVMDVLPADEELVSFVNAGVRGFVMKDATVDDLVATIEAVANGTNVLPPVMLSSLFSQIARETIRRGRPAVAEASQMTPRERQVVLLIGEGLSNKEIAARLQIATHTVKSHVRNVMEKLSLHTRLQIAAYLHSDATL
ncbi:MAG: response regulator transcription factor [Gemmatimonadaceae bacterium]|nr:response regulator transcription factor [Gemmatimonadaceae bacterium]